MESKSEIVLRSEAMPPASTPQEALSLAITHNVDPAVLRQMLEVQERWEAMEAKKAYVKAMSAFKRETPAVLNKDAKVDFSTQKGRTHYKYASLGGIIEQLTPKLSEHGLSVSFACAQEGNGIAVTCQITHERGHSERVTLTAPRDDSGNKNPIQMIGSAVTYLQRYTLLAALGLATADQDDDGIASGARRGDEHENGAGRTGGQTRPPESANSATRPGPAPAPSHSPEHEALANEAAAAMDGKPAIPPCPKCGAVMNERSRKDGKGRFYGCTKYPECKGTVPIHDTPEGQAKEAAPAPQTKTPAQQSTLTAMTPEEKAEFTRIRKATGLEGLATWQAFLFTNKLPSTLATRNQVEAAYSALKKYQVELFTKDAESAPDAEQPPEKCPACDAAGKVRSASATEWVCEDCGAVWSKGQ
jgi:ssDNA-binding Zn-finger/Zn-ribbon topoisomerase 1